MVTTRDRIGKDGTSGTDGYHQTHKNSFNLTNNMVASYIACSETKFQTVLYLCARVSSDVTENLLNFPFFQKNRKPRRIWTVDRVK